MGPRNLHLFCSPDGSGMGNWASGPETYTPDCRLQTPAGEAASSSLSQVCKPQAEHLSL